MKDRKDSLIAVLCEGGAEEAIMNILLDNNFLIFSRKQLLWEKVLPRMKARKFEKEYLSQEFDQKIIILRVIDSRNENFKLSKAYQCQVEVVDIITAPEIEMLVIIASNKYDNFSRSNIKKPSDYCKNYLKISNVKKDSFILEFFAYPNKLLSSIKKYNQIHKKNLNEYSLYDLLKEELR